MKTRIVKDMLVFSSSRYAILGLGAIRNFFVAKLLGPDQYSYWILFLLAQLYGDQAHFGLRLAGDKEIPIHKGKGDEISSDNISNHVLTGILILSLISFVLLIGGSSFFISDSTKISDYDVSILRSGLFFTAFIIVTDQIGRYFLMILRTRKEFSRISAIETLTEVIRTSFVIILGIFFHLNGAFVAYLVASFAMAVYLLFRFHGLYKLSWEFRGIRRISWIGIPLFLNNIAALVIISFDRIVGSASLDVTDFSYYGFATTIILLPVFASHGLKEVLFPTFGERFGAGGNTSSLYPIYSKTLYAIALLSPFIVGAVLFGGEFLIYLFLPEFIPSVPLIYMLSNGIYFMAIASLPVAVLLITGRGWSALVVEIFSISTAIVIYFSLIPVFGSMKSLAIGTCLLYFLFGMATLYITLYQCELPRRVRMREIILIASPIFLSIATIFVLSFIFPLSDMTPEQSLYIIPLKALCFFIVYSAVLFFANGKVEFLSSLRSSIQTKFVKS